MIMQKFLLLSQTVISVIITLLILMQNKDGGLGGIMGGDTGSFKATRRGADKVIFNITVLLGILFLANALAFVFV